MGGFSRPVALAAAMLFTLTMGCQRGGLQPGSRAPDFVVQTLDGKVTKLSNYRGHPVLLNLWATWCPPCIEEIPLLNAVQEDYGPRGLVVLGVAGDEQPETVARFIDKFPVKFEVLLDPKGVVGTEYAITGYPETFFIDREGRLTEKFVGPLPAEGEQLRADVKSRIDALIGG